MDNIMSNRYTFGCIKQIWRQNRYRIQIPMCTWFRIQIFNSHFACLIGIRNKILIEIMNYFQALVGFIHIHLLYGL